MEFLEISDVPLVFYKDPFLRTKKQLGVVANFKKGKRAKATEKSKEEEAGEEEEVASLVDSREGCIEEEVPEMEGDEVMEELAASEPRKSNNVVDRKAEGKL